MPALLHELRCSSTRYSFQVIRCHEHNCIKKALEGSYRMAIYKTPQLTQILSYSPLKLEGLVSLYGRFFP